MSHFTVSLKCTKFDSWHLPVRPSFCPMVSSSLRSSSALKIHCANTHVGRSVAVVDVRKSDMCYCCLTCNVVTAE